jgi:hypothetical protein
LASSYQRSGIKIMVMRSYHVTDWLHYSHGLRKVIGLQASKKFFFKHRDFSF